MTDQDEQADRLREPPADRFAGESHMFDLDELLASLRTEDHPSRDGHRQITLFHRPPVAHVLFAFDADGRLAKHSAPGEVTIHVLEGRLRVEVDGADHDLRAGSILVLGKGVPHDVRALEASAMLLTVHLGAG
jgi:quercetin dioxygenase-like cupin family protein